jgi:hypothetical protein
MALERIRFGRCTLLFPTTSVGTAAGEEQRRRPPREVTCARAQPPADTTGRDVAGMLKPAAGVVTSDGAERIADRLVHGLDGTSPGRSHGQSSRWTYVRNVGPFIVPRITTGATTPPRRRPNSIVKLGSGFAGADRTRSRPLHRSYGGSDS